MGNLQFSPDLELNGFEVYQIHQPDDYEGKVICSLIRKSRPNRKTQAALHIHGFNDYFFHSHLSDLFEQHDIELYGLDLRKSGRSYLSHQTFNGLTDISEYLEDIYAALQLIRQEGATRILLMGHSLGGLAVSIFAAKHTSIQLFDSVFLNSPFFEHKKDIFTKKILIPIVSAVASMFPNIRIPGGFSRFYGPSLHASEFGEWNYNLSFKPHKSPMVKASWIKAVHEAQQTIRKGIQFEEPVLVMYPSKTVSGFRWKEAFQKADAIVNVQDIRKRIPDLHAPKSIVEIEDGKHDLFLSLENVRQTVLTHLFDWHQKVNNQNTL